MKNSNAVDILYSGPRSEYLERELNWVHVANLVNNNGARIRPEVVLVGQKIREVISLFKIGRRIYVYLYADETYKLIPSFLLFINPRVKLIFRSYPIHDLQYHRFLDLLRISYKFLRSSRSRKDKSMFIQSLLAGLIIGLRQTVLKGLESIRFPLNLSSTWLPLGYTNKFALEFCENVGIEHSSESLIKFFMLQHDSILSNKSFQIAFRGQKGKFQRQEFIRSVESGFAEIPRVFHLNDYFGGERSLGDLESCGLNPYVTELFNSSHALCPPGNYSRETFRYWESLLCGCSPIESDLVLSDPFRNSSGISHASFVLQGCSFRKATLSISLPSEKIEDISRWRSRLLELNQCMIAPELSVLSLDRDIFPPNS